MGVHVEWDDTEKTILYYSFRGDWTWENAQSAHLQTRALLDEIDYPVYLIFDFSQTNSIPPNPLFNIKRALLDHPLIEIRMIVGMNSLMREFLNLASKILPVMRARHILFLGSLDEARTKISEHHLAQQ